jgi:alkylation response protein AidB-like acyl-CoA dehydrogenase
MNLLYSDVEEQLRSSVRDLLAKRAPAAATIARMESAEPYDPALWRALAVEVGVTALAVPEERGGHGASWREVAVVAEELGASVAPTPFLGHTLASVAARVAGSEDLAAKLVAGEVTGTLAVSAGSVRETNVSVVDGRLTGTVRGVIDAVTADVLLVPTDAGLFAVAASDAQRSPVASLDMTRPLCDIDVDDAPGTRLSEGHRARDAALLISGALLASEQVGLAQRCLDLTVDYLKTRYQFARPIGSYQALKHRVADLWAAITQARAVTRYAAGCVADHDDDAPVAVELAQAYCLPVAVRAAEECVQLHGGIGFTWEHPAHLYLKRAKANAILFGTAAQHRARLGDLVALPLS